MLQRPVILPSALSRPSSYSTPFSIVWTPLPGLTALVPSVGHVGVTTSHGIIHDFSASYTVSIGRLAFGDATYIWSLDPVDPDAWDKAIDEADEEFSKRKHHLIR